MLRCIASGNSLVSMTMHVFPKLGYHAVDTIAVDVRERKKGASPFGKTSPKVGGGFLDPVDLPTCPPCEGERLRRR